VEQRVREARTKEMAAWVGKVLWVGEGEGKGKPDVMMRVAVVGGGKGGQIQWIQIKKKGWGMGEGTQKDWVSEREGSGKGNIGGKERDETAAPKRPVHMGLQTTCGFGDKNYQDQ
jgi:hypothetical protein